MIDHGYKLINMPLELSREVQRRDVVDPDKWVRDDVWYEQTERAYDLFLRFIADASFLIDGDRVLREGTRAAVVTRGDLSDEGFEFYKYAFTRWLNYSDRYQGTDKFDPQKKLNSLLRAFRKL